MAAFRFAVLAFAASSVLAATAWAQPAPVEASASAPGAAVPVENSALDAPLFYQLLIGEMELGQGDAGTSYQVLLDAARKTRDERLFRRATEVA